MAAVAALIGDPARANMLAALMGGRALTAREMAEEAGVTAQSAGHQRTRTGPKDVALREARVCYNHLAGEMGVRMFDSLARRGLIRVEGEDVALTEAGEGFAEGFGIDLAPLRRARAPLCRACLDWSVRRSHLAGSLGRALMARMLEQGWARRDPQGRAIRFTAQGRRAFDAAFPAMDQERV